MTLPRPFSAFSNQSGALFGLDARIALAIFGILSVVAGVSIVTSIDGTRGQVLATELADTAQALESFHHDLKTDIFLSLETPTEKGAFQALFDNSVIRTGDNLQARWNGPYIKASSNLHPRYGAMTLTKAGPVHSSPCIPSELCYLYVVYSNVKMDIAKKANEVLDGEAETDAGAEGRLQWSRGDEGTNLRVYFRAIRALSNDMDY